MRALRSQRQLPWALALVLVLALAGCSAGDPASDARQTRSGLAAIAPLAQSGFTLGRSDAPWTLSIISSPTSYELDDLITVLPALSDAYVRSGRVRLQLRLATKGPYGDDGRERTAAGFLLAAGLQNRLWNLLVRFVANYDGRVTVQHMEDLLRQARVPDLDRAMVDRVSPRIRSALDRGDAMAAEAKGDGHLVYVLTSKSGAEYDLTRQADKGRLVERIGRALAGRLPQS